jgi:pimeloyl-ACP methyl ester carboxylesterase
LGAPAPPVVRQRGRAELDVSSDYEAPDADPPGLVCKSLNPEFGVAVVPVRKGGHLVQIEQPEATEQIVRQHLRARGFEIPAR